MGNASTQLTHLDTARRALALARSIDEVKQIRDKAEALRHYIQQQGASLEIQNDCAEIKLRAERRAGEMLGEMEKNPGTKGQLVGPGVIGSNMVQPPITKLSDLGISRIQSHRWQLEARVPEDVFEQHISQVKAQKEELTSRGLLKLALRLSRSEARAVNAPELQEGSEILTGDIKLLYEYLADGSADLFFTDPPYGKETLHIFGEVAQLAEAKLKPTGFCLAYTPHEHLPSVLQLMMQHLNFWWIFAVHQKGAEARIWKRHLWVKWKPILVFTKAALEPVLPHEWVMDAIDGQGEDKRYHDWGQDVAEATYWIKTLVPRGGLVVDPLCGAGTIPLAAKLTGRRWLGTDKDPQAAALARLRLQEEPVAVP